MVLAMQENISTIF